MNTSLFPLLVVRLALSADVTGAQCDNVCGLNWYTDFDAARQVARAEGKPIVSLRLLGRLDEDLSCANSRFFRTAVYANEQVAAALKERFILHWQSVRPVPRITIDFGDGRRLERTITGNSLHYMLDAEGRPLDALPGLCGPGPFLDWIEASHGLYARLEAAASPRQRARELRDHHVGAYNRSVAAWQEDPELRVVKVAAFPTALEAAPIAVTKAGVEMPVLRMLAPLGDRLEARTDDAAWSRLAERYLDGSRLDRSSLAVMARKTAVTPGMVERFERMLAEDAVRNEYLHHRRIHEWFANGEVGPLQELTRRIYDELFLTPDEDPWLGLLPAGTYAALEDNGVAGP